MSIALADRQKEIDNNLDYFLSELRSLKEAHAGKFALLRHKSIVGFYDTPMDAVASGNALYEDRLFSVQQVTEVAVDLGFFSHAGVLGTTQQ